MKIKNLAIIIFIASVLGISQQNEKTIKIDKYLNILQEFQINKEYEMLGNLQEHEFKLIIKEMYEAIEIAPVELNAIFADDHNRWIEEIKFNRNNLYYKVKYGIVQNALLDEVKKRYSEIIYILIRVPVLIKAQVVSIKEDYDKDGFGKFVLRLKPEQIIKGEVSFINEQEFDVYYRNYEMIPASKEFKVGKSYLVPLWDRNEPANPEFAIATWIDKSGSRFLIENETLYDEHNIFNMGTKVKWVEFVKNINDLIFRIKNSMEY
jgi:hypothetical protein